MVHRPGPKQVSPAVATAQERTQEAKEAHAEVTASAERAERELQALDADMVEADTWAWLEMKQAVDPATLPD